MNPTVPQSFIDQAYSEDEAHASAEFGAEFRKDIESFINREVVEACIVKGRRELPPRLGIRYGTFTDPSGGSSESFTLSIAHEERGHVVVDAVREQRAPFDPDATVAEFAALLKDYGISQVSGDRYGGEWPAERFRAHGISYRQSELTKSELYRELLHKLNAGTIELLEHETATRQLLGLERRTTSSGREIIDHGPRGRDDVVNAIAGVAHEVRGRNQKCIATLGPDVSWQSERSGRPALLHNDPVVGAILLGAEMGASLWKLRKK
jgi:hypothetical protein